MLQSERLINMDYFKQEIQQGLCDILDSIDNSLAASELPLAINREMLVSRLSEMIPNETYHLLSNNTEVANLQLEKAETKLLRGLGSLIRLPRELRDMIYPKLIASGHTEVLRASPALMMEGAKFLPMDGICRMNFGDGQKIPTINPSQSIADNIQNISINVSTHCGRILGGLPEVEILEKFGGSQVLRNNCTVTFECWPTSSRMVASGVLNKLKTYTGFENIVVTIKLEWQGEPWKGLADFQEVQISSTLIWAINDVKEYLEPTLGNAYRDWNFDDPTMVFFPRNATMAIVEEGVGRMSEAEE